VRRASIFLHRVLAAALLGLGGVSCGASLQALYEGDVRFEHCMALDSQREVKPTIRRACWDEWRKFYTFGQTRDRIEYAALRDRQLGGASDFDEGEWQLEKSGKASSVDTMSALAPPPILMAAVVVDAGAEEALRPRPSALRSAKRSGAPVAASARRHPARRSAPASTSAA
jgi:hypothetical protein